MNLAMKMANKNAAKKIAPLKEALFHRRTKEAQAMTGKEISATKARISEIDKWFEGATGWGSWMVGMANEREDLVNKLQLAGQKVEHKHLARSGSGGRVS